MKVIVVLERQPPAALSFSQMRIDEEVYCFVSLCHFQEVYDLSDFFKPDLFLFDEHLDGISGTALATLLLSKKGMAGVPIVLRLAEGKKQEKNLTPNLFYLEQSSDKQILFALIKQILQEPGLGKDPLLSIGLPFTEYSYGQAPGLNEQHPRSQEENARDLTAPVNWKNILLSGHFVQFYEQDKILLDQLSTYIAEGLLSGDGCIVVATKAHQQELDARLQARGLDLAAAHSQDAYIRVDALEALSLIQMDGELAPDRFAEVAGSLIRRAAWGRRSVRIFGEIVALLWEQQRYQAVLRLEELWNDLQKNFTPFSLFCAYPNSYFAEPAHQILFDEICKRHNHVSDDSAFA